MVYWALTLDIDPDPQRNVLKFGYEKNFKYEGQLSHSIDRFYILAKCLLPKLKDIPMVLKRKPVDYSSFAYLSPHNSKIYSHMWGDVRNGQVP